MDWSRPFGASYRWVRVSRSTGYEVAQVTNVTGGSITRNSDSATFEGARATCVGPLDLGTDLLRCYLVAEQDGAAEEVCLGTWLPSMPSRDLRGGLEERDVTLDGRLLELAQDSFDGPMGVWGDPVAAARNVVEGCGLQVVVAAEGPFPTVSLTFGLEDSQDSPGGSKLDCVNALLDLAGLRSATTDPWGRVVFSRGQEQPYGTPSWEFREGAGANFLDEVTEELDSSDVCNVVLAIYETSGATVIGEAIDSDPASPWSTVSLGRRKVAKYRYNATATQAQADARAARLLRDQRSVVHRVTVTHAYCPLSVGDVAEVAWPSAGISGRFAVRTQAVTLGPACLTRSELRRFDRG